VCAITPNAIDSSVSARRLRRPNARSNFVAARPEKHSFDPANRRWFAKLAMRLFKNIASGVI
jgi:hypothetical protein